MMICEQHALTASIRPSTCACANLMWLPVPPQYSDHSPCGLPNTFNPHLPSPFWILPGSETASKNSAFEAKPLLKSKTTLCSWGLDVSQAGPPSGQS